MSTFGESAHVRDARKKAREAGNLAMAKADLEFRAQRERLDSAEKARFMVGANLGAPGTYEASYEDFYDERSGGKDYGDGFLLGKDIIRKLRLVSTRSRRPSRRQNLQHL